MYKDIEDLIARSKKSAEIKRGLAVRQDIANQSRKVIGSVLGVTVAFISKWRIIYDTYGVNALISYHKGGTPRSFLNAEQRGIVLAHIQSHEVFTPKDLAVYLQREYGIFFKSGQSYYDLLHAAKMSYHKSQKENPRRDEAKIMERRKEIKKNLKRSEKR